MPTFDPLRIYYLVILGSDDPYDVTAFQGFSPSWMSVSWAMNCIAELPADVLEPTYKPRDVIAQRMGGVRSLSWAPLSLAALEAVKANELGVFILLFSGEESTAERIVAWGGKQKHPVLHISTCVAEGAIHPDELTLDVLQKFCSEALGRVLN